MYDFTISIVLFHTDPDEIVNVVDLINKSSLKKKIYLIDNSRDNSLSKLATLHHVQYIYNGANLGYGAAHNVAIALAKGEASYHLIMNSDIEFDPAILDHAVKAMSDNPHIGMISPKIINAKGELQHFCRQLPNPFDLITRRFVPKFLKPLFKKQMDEYLFLDRDYSKPMRVANLPGCFMFVRTTTLIEVGGFDPDFFLYVEDVDLTRRLNRISITLYYPEIVITHHLAQGSYKFSKLAWYHIRSAVKYFNKWGWLSDSYRTETNRRLSDNDNLLFVNPPLFHQKLLFEMAKSSH